jgi:molecular chaperone DnaJ
MANAKRDYYEILGVAKDADAAAIKSAYRKLAIKLHPDRNKQADAAERFKEVSEAYAVLSDAEKRQRYDQFGHAGIDQQYSSEDLFRGADFEDILRGFGAGSIFDMFFGGRQQAARGRDLQVLQTITLEEAFTGTEKDISYMRQERCERCHGEGAEPGTQVQRCTTCAGRGQVQVQQRTPFGVLSQVAACRACGGRGRNITHPCQTCRASGQQRKQQTVSVTIPAGIEDGQSLRVSGKGETGGGVPDGDLYVQVRIKQHERFHREGPDLLTELPISFPQAVLGADVDLDTLDGTVSVKVPPASETGKTLRLRGRGMPYLQGAGRGDLHVRLRVVVPEKISNRGKELLRELSEELDKDVKGKRSIFDFLKGH